AGGAKGQKIFFVSCGAPAPAVAGTAGTIFNSYNFRISSVMSTSCAFALPVQLLSFTVIPVSNSAILDWQIASVDDLNEFSIERKQDNGQWIEIKKFKPEISKLQYQFKDLNLASGVFQYRLKISEKNEALMYSPAKLIHIKNKTSFNIFPNPAKKSISIIYSFHSNSQLKIYNNIGQLVLSKKVSINQTVFQVDVSFLKRGIYRVVVDDQTKTLVIE
ncbi:MAG: T9SS type A sorting domain-containing protein, partial [Flavisolibacter sp.]